jgi:hypothetical protein
LQLVAEFRVSCAGWQQPASKQAFGPPYGRL